MSRLRSLSLVVGLSMAATAAWAVEPVPPPGAGNSSTTQSTLNTSVESARLGPNGVLEAEFAYRAGIEEYHTPWGERTLHTGVLLFGYAVERMEFRAGWDMFGVVPDDLENISGVGDPWFEGKFTVNRLPAISRPHALALLARFRPGIGQVPVRVNGVTLGLDGMYTIGFGTFDIDTLAGVSVNTAEDPAYVSVPLGGRILWHGTPVVDVYGEVTETLHLTALRASETQIDAGCAIRPADSFEFTVTAGLGLSESLPAGFIQFGVAFLLSKLES